MAKKTREMMMSDLGRAKDHDCRVLSVETELPEVVRIRFEGAEIASVASPGQFVQVEPSAGLFPVTRRPFTIDRVTETAFELLFDVVGRGTALLAKKKVGDTVKVLGPLGRGWRTEYGSNWLLIGGGLGAAGFRFLLDTVSSAVVLVGASSSDRVLQLPSSLVVTEDGSSGEKGIVTDLITENILKDADSVAVCGPLAMMEAVWKKIPPEYRNRVQVSTESRMGCGWGACDGCSIPVSGGGYSKCCLDGPVFMGSEIDWERWKEVLN